MRDVTRPALARGKTRGSGRFSLMTRSWILGVVCGALALPGFALAQDNDDDVDRFGPEGNNWELTLNGSGFNDKDFDNGAFGGGLSIGYFFNEHFEIALRQSANYVD